MPAYSARTQTQNELERYTTNLNRQRSGVYNAFKEAKDKKRKQSSLMDTIKRILNIK